MLEEVTADCGTGARFASGTIGDVGLDSRKVTRWLRRVSGIGRSRGTSRESD